MGKPGPKVVVDEAGLPVTLRTRTVAKVYGHGITAEWGEVDANSELAEVEGVLKLTGQAEDGRTFAVLSASSSRALNSEDALNELLPFFAAYWRDELRKHQPEETPTNGS